jgi:Flp pilus assembly protein TadG
MFRVITKLRRQIHLKSDDGAVTILFTVIVLMGVMVGLFALVVDGGQLMLERRVVQNVADASALYLGQNCALGQNCSTNDPITYAQNNSPDLNTAISEKCGSSPLPGCGPLSSNTKDCQSTPTGTSQFVRVRAQTQTISGGTALAPAFAGIFGDGNVSDGSWTMRACSQAKWGKSGQAIVTLPLAMSVCSYATPTNSVGGANKLIPQYTPANAACTGTPSLDGLTLSGKDAGLAAVAIPNMDAACSTGTRLNVGDTVTYVAPVSMTTLCSGFLNRLKAAIGQQSYIPVFATSTVTGTTRKMQVVSFVRFKVMSLKYGGVLYGAPTFTSTACANLCIVGQFTKGVAPIGKISTNSAVPSLGAMAVELIP